MGGSSPSNNSETGLLPSSGSASFCKRLPRVTVEGGKAQKLHVGDFQGGEGDQRLLLFDVAQFGWVRMGTLSV